MIDHDRSIGPGEDGRPVDFFPSELVPSSKHPNALAALEGAFEGAVSISIAVAFVSESGVRQLGELLDRRPGVKVELVARAAGVTSPDALVTLRDEMGVDVSVVIGRRASTFHPKLWLIRSPERLTALSGSGNLTVGGLVENDEQFELTRMPLSCDRASGEEERFEQLTARAHPLDEVEDTTIWTEWLTILRRQRMHRREIDRLEAQLASREVVANRADDRQSLLNDLVGLYELTVAEEIRTKEGRRYVPTRFKQGIERAENGGDPVRLVYRICRHQTGGFDVILAADRPDLTVEYLVVDTSKPYHDLFTDSTRDLSARRLRQFPSWSNGEA